MEQGLNGRPGGLSSASPTAPVVAAVPVSIPDAEWPLWAIVTTYEECRNNAMASVTGFRWAFAPTEQAAITGMERELRAAERYINIEVFAREVPTQAIEARRAATLGAVHESAVLAEDASND